MNLRDWMDRIVSYLQEPVPPAAAPAPLPEPTRTALAQSAWPSQLALAIAAIVGLAMLGWLLGEPTLASFLPHHTPLPVTTAYGLLLLAAALHGLQTPMGQRFAAMAGGLVALLGLYTLAESRLAWLPDPHEPLAAPFLDLLPGLQAHPTPHAAVGFTLLGLALWLNHTATPRRTLAAQICALLTLFGTLVVLTAYLHENPQIYSTRADPGMAPPAALAMFLLAMGILAYRPKLGIMALFTAPQLGSRMLRRLLPAAIILPMLIIWATHEGVELGWYAWELEGAVLSVLSMLLLIGALLLMTHVLNRESEALHQAKELLEKIFSSAPTLTVYLDRNMNFVKVNAAYAAADRKRPEDFVGKNHFVLYPNPEYEAIFRRVIETGQPYNAYARPFEYPDQPERGTTYWDWNLYPVFDSTGRVDGLVFGLHEVTERQRAEQQRLAAEAKFHELFNAINDAVFIHPLDGPFIEINAAACRRLGYRREELLRLGPKDIDSPAHSSQIEARTQQLRDRHEAVFETEHLTKGGQRIPVEVSARLIELDGKPHVLSVARDIWARKEIENTLREHHQTTQALINATTESALLIDVDGTIRAINDVGARRFQHTPDEMVGHDVFRFMRPEVAKGRREMLDQVRFSRQPHRAEDVRNGHRFEHNLYPVLDARGQVNQVAIYAKDITERHQTQVLDRLLHGIDQAVLRGTALDALLDFICDGLAEALDLPFAWIGRKEADGRIAILARAAGADDYVRHLQEIGVRWDDSLQGRGPSGMAIRTGQTQLVHIEETAFAPWRAAAQVCGYAAVLALPLILRGEVYGMVGLYAANSDTFTDPHMRERMENLTGRINVALEMNQDQERTRLLGAALASASNGVFITDAGGRIQWCNAAFSRLCGYAEPEIVGRTPAILKSGHQDDAYYRKLWETIQAGETWSSETVERHKDGSLFTVQQTVTPIHDYQGAISHFIAIMEDITAQKATEAKIYRMAHYDALTDLPNRAMFRERLSQALALARRGEHQAGLLFLDLDKFKTINDTLGHHVGDFLLQGVAERLKDCVRETDTVARLAGDEFTVILQGIETVADAEAVASKIVARLAEPFLLDGQTVRTAASIGIALAPLHAGEDEALIKLADDAMYRAKAAGRGCYRAHGAD